MPEKTKLTKDIRTEKEKEAETTLTETKKNDQAAWGRDQQEKSYYYDDAHGYEIYNPEEDEDG